MVVLETIRRLLKAEDFLSESAPSDTAPYFSKEELLHVNNPTVSYPEDGIRSSFSLIHHRNPPDQGFSELLAGESKSSI